MIYTICPRCAYQVYRIGQITGQDKILLNSCYYECWWIFGAFVNCVRWWEAGKSQPLPTQQSTTQPNLTQPNPTQPHQPNPTQPNPPKLFFCHGAFVCMHLKKVFIVTLGDPAVWLGRDKIACTRGWKKRVPTFCGRRNIKKKTSKIQTCWNGGRRGFSFGGTSKPKTLVRVLVRSDFTSSKKYDTCEGACT